MRLFYLGPRLGMAADMVLPGTRIADIGTDHARLPIWLIKTGRCPSAVATDIAEPPFRRAIEECRRYGVEKDVKLVMCDGLDGVCPQDCECVTICGMGGNTMIDILSRAPWTKDGRTLILQPEKAAGRLREFLYRNGYTIEDERAAVDGRHIFNVIKARGGTSGDREDPLYVRISRPMAEDRDAAVRKYIEREIRMIKNEIKGMEDHEEISCAEVVRARMEELLKK